MRINSLKTAAAASLVAIALSCFGSVAHAAQSAHPATGTAVRADAAPVQTAQAANDPWD